MSLTQDQIIAALRPVEDPELRRSIVDLGMVRTIQIDAGAVVVQVALTVPGCPLRNEIQKRVTDAVQPLAEGRSVSLDFIVMTDGERENVRRMMMGDPASTAGSQPAQGHAQGRVIPFAQPGSRTRPLLIASGKGGVGKSSITSNLAAAMAQQGLSVGVVDADIYGHSIPRMLGVTGTPHQVEGMIMPPEANGVRVISMLPFKPGGVSQPVAFRGPMLHRALQQFLTDVWWGDLDVLLLDLPPGTGDIAISVAQLLPGAQIVVVTTPQAAAAEVAVRAGMLSQQTHSRVAGVIENMSGVPCPHCGEPIDLFGVGGGAIVSEQLTAELGTDVPLLGRVPFDIRLREGSDAGLPLVLSAPESPAAEALLALAANLGGRPRGLAGISLGLTPARSS